jgi:hypothetical protein
MGIHASDRPAVLDHDRCLMALVVDKAGWIGLTERDFRQRGGAGEGARPGTPGHRLATLLRTVAMPTRRRTKTRRQTPTWWSCHRRGPPCSRGRDGWTLHSPDRPAASPARAQSFHQGPRVSSTPWTGVYRPAMTAPTRVVIKPGAADGDPVDPGLRPECPRGAGVDCSGHAVPGVDGLAQDARARRT